MATRFYLGSTASPSISPAFDSNWEQTGQAIRRVLYYKMGITATEALTDTTSLTVPITTTQDILAAQFVGPPMGYPIRFDARNFSMVVGKCSENATTNNVHLAYSMRVLSQDGGTVRGTLRSSFANITEFAVTASAATRIIAAGAVTDLTTEAGDRLCLEVGIHVSGPTASGSAVERFGFSATSDFALTSALTTDLNSWCEFEQDLFDMRFINYQHVKVGDGMSMSGKLR